MNKNNLINSKNKLIPLFSSALNNKQNINNNIKEINTIEIIKIYLRGITLYNNTLNKFLLNNSRYALIREIRYDEYNKLNIMYNNYLYLINRYFPIFKFRSLIYNLDLFLDNRILKYNKLYIYTHRLRSRYLNRKYKEINNKEININNIRIISKLIEKGDKLNLYILNLINKKKVIINKYKYNNLFQKTQYNINNIINKKSLLQILELINQKKNNYDNLLSLNNKKLNILNTFKYLNNNNINNINNTRKSINNINNFNITNNINNTSPIQVSYYNKDLNKPIINQYLKELSKFNMFRKGIFIKYNQFICYNFNNSTYKLIKNIYKLLFASFKSMYALISKPVFTITPDKIIIHIFYYLFVPNLLKLKQFNLLGNKNRNLKELKFRHSRFKLQISKFRRFKKMKVNILNLSSNALTKVFSNKFKILCNILSNLFKKPVELNLTRLHYPYFDSNILVNLLGIMINKIKLRIIIRKLFANTVIKNLNNINLNRNNNIIPAFLTGINIKVAGRLMTQRVTPRKTVKTVIRGASARSKVNFLDVGRISNKNRRGAFSITVKSGQNYF